MEPLPRKKLADYNGEHKLNGYRRLSATSITLPASISSRHSLTNSSFPPLGHDNPYDQYSEGEEGIFDLGGIMTSAGGQHDREAGVQQSVETRHTSNVVGLTREMVQNKYDDFLHNESTENENNTSGHDSRDVEKRAVEPTTSPRQHAEYLKTQLNADNRKQDGRLLLTCLQELDNDLMTATESYVSEFIKEPLNGLALLVRILFKIQGRRAALKGSSRRLKIDQYKQVTEEENCCLKCIKGCIQFVTAIPRLLKERDAIECIAYSSLSDDIATSIVAIQVLTLVCDSPRGSTEIMKGIADLSSKMGEGLRFSRIVTQLNKSMDIQFMTVCFRLFNKLWRTTDSTNGKIYLQHDLELAGFDPDNLRMDSVSDTQNFEFDCELALWKDNYLNGASNLVQLASKEPPLDLTDRMERMEEQIQQQQVELEEQQTRNHHFRLEINRQQNLIKELEDTAKKSEETQNELEEQCADYREKMDELTKTMNKLKVLYKDRTGLDADEDMADGGNPRAYGTQRGNRMKPYRYGDPIINERVVRPPMPSNITGTVRRKIHVSVNLPQLNWTPLMSIESTLFEELDPNSVIRQLDFTDFESKFQLVTREETQQSLDRKKLALQKSSERISFIDRNRAKNMIITKKKKVPTATLR